MTIATEHLCEMCHKQKRVLFERFCSACRVKRLYEMMRVGYLQSVRGTTIEPPIESNDKTPMRLDWFPDTTMPANCAGWFYGEVRLTQFNSVVCPVCMNEIEDGAGVEAECVGLVHLGCLKSSGFSVEQPRKRKTKRRVSLYERLFMAEAARVKNKAGRASLKTGEQP
jgi:hypothetical protein